MSLSGAEGPPDKEGTEGDGHREEVRDVAQGTGLPTDDVEQHMEVDPEPSAGHNVQIVQHTGVPGGSILPQATLQHTRMRTPNVSAEQLDMWIEDILTLEQQLGQTNIQVGKSYLFLSRVLHSMETPQSLRMALNSLQRAYEIMLHWKVHMEGSMDPCCANHFQYLFDSIHRKLALQQQSTFHAGRMDAPSGSQSQ